MKSRKSRPAQNLGCPLAWLQADDYAARRTRPSQETTGDGLAGLHKIFIFLHYTYISQMYAYVYVLIFAPLFLSPITLK